MEEKNISLTAIIIITVIIFALILCMIAFIIYSNNKDSNSFSSTVHNTAQQQTSSATDEQTINSNDSTFKKDSSATNNTNSNDDSQQNTSSSQTNSVTGKSSSNSSPLSIGEWGIASKYGSGNYTDVPVKVTNVTRGDSATQMVKDFCNTGSSIYKYSEPDDDMEWAVVDYTVDLSNFKAPSSSGDKTIKVDSKVTGTGNSSAVKYNGNTYIISTTNMTSGTTKENIANGQFAVQLPIGCTDYLIVLGTSSHTQAFFKGK